MNLFGKLADKQLSFTTLGTFPPLSRLLAKFLFLQKRRRLREGKAVQLSLSPEGILNWSGIDASQIHCSFAPCLSLGWYICFWFKYISICVFVNFHICACPFKIKIILFILDKFPVGLPSISGCSPLPENIILLLISTEIRTIHETSLGPNQGTITAFQIDRASKPNLTEPLYIQRNEVYRLNQNWPLWPLFLCTSCGVCSRTSGRWDII